MFPGHYEPRRNEAESTKEAHPQPETAPFTETKGPTADCQPRIDRTHECSRIPDDNLQQGKAESDPKRLNAC